MVLATPTPPTSSATGAEAEEESGERALKPGLTHTEWNRGPANPDWPYAQPDLGKRFNSVRDGDRLSVAYAPFNVGEGGHHARMYLGTDVTGTTTVRRDGVLLGNTPSPVGVTVTVLEELANYTVTSTATREAGWTPVGTKDETTWTFRSGLERLTGRLLSQPRHVVDLSFALEAHRVISRQSA